MSFLLFNFLCSAQRFDFGNGSVATGFKQVSAQMLYSADRGFGFENTDSLQSVNRGGKGVNGDFIHSKRPFSFSVQLPEGNYDVKVYLGDTKGTSATTVRAECRRLMLENITTSYGNISTPSFTVHIRDSVIRNQQGNPIGKVRLKPREILYLHWDNRLTIEFNDTLAKVCGVEITPNKKATTIFLAGNSTVVDQDREPWAAWGQMIPRFFEAGKVAIANYAESGEALNSFASAKRLEKILHLMKKGDYLFIEFGHNDQKQKGEGQGAFTSYKKMLHYYISETRKKGGIPVLITSMHRRNFDSAGAIINTLGDFPEAVRQTAREEKVAIIDLNAMSEVLYEAWGVQTSLKAFVHYPANSFPDQPEPLKDNTHFSPYGAYQLAQCIVLGIRQQQLPIASFLRKDIAAFTPAKPVSPEHFYWPPSTMQAAVRPDGN